MVRQHVPQRTCVACRRARGKWELLRVVRMPLGEVRVDPTGKLAGRGAYLCRDENCLAQAIKQRKLTRALATAIGPDVVDAIKATLGESPDAKRSERQGER